jgi:hypothetical protein
MAHIKGFCKTIRVYKRYAQRLIEQFQLQLNNKSANLARGFIDQIYYVYDASRKGHKTEAH